VLVSACTSRLARPRAPSSHALPPPAPPLPPLPSNHYDPRSLEAEEADFYYRYNYQGGGESVAW
jgi:hypothetical protein